MTRATVEDSTAGLDQTHGIKVPEGEMENGDAMKMTFAVMSATTPLAVVIRVVKTGHRVLFSPDESYVETLAGAKAPSC